MHDSTSVAPAESFGNLQDTISIPFDVFINDHFAATIEADCRSAAEELAKLRFGHWLDDILRVVDRFEL